MSDALLHAAIRSHLKTDLPVISIGDTVDVHVRIVEGAKERVQVFTGVVTRRANSGINETITVRRIVANEGVERTFPVHSPRVAKIEVSRHGHTRRSKLYYLRERVGKKRRLKDRKRGLGWLVQQEEQQAAEAADRAAKEKAAADAAPKEAEA